jgi:hypothetical protein
LVHHENRQCPRREDALLAAPGSSPGPLTRPQKKRRLGLLDGKFKIPDDFNEPLPDEVIAGFEGRRR